MSIHRRAAKRVARGEEGLALVTTLIVLVAMAMLIAGALRGALTGSRTSSSDYFASKTFYAAEAGGESALAQLEQALLDGVISDPELSSMTPPTLEGYTFNEFQVVKDGPVIQETITDGPFAGLYSFTQNLTITSQATHVSGANAAVVLGAKGQAIPIFQFGEFYEAANADAAGSRKDMYGRVHANRGFFLSGQELVFHEYVTTPNKFYRDDLESHKDPVADNIHVYVDDASANENEVTFDSGDTPDPDAFKALSEANHDGRLRTDAFGVDSLKLPLPVGLPPRELVRLKELDDTDAEKAVKFAWTADMYVTVDLSNIQSNSTVCNGSGSSSQQPTITVTRPYGGAVPSDDDKCKIFNFKWEIFYDNDEEGWIDVLDVDINELKNWLNNSGSSTSITYVEFIDGPVAYSSITDPNNDGTSFDGSYHPVLRVMNGSELPSPLTLGSERPLWVQGDYNNVNWKPSALFGDRLGAMSNDWDDNVARPYGNDCKYNSNCGDVTGDVWQYFAVVSGKSEGFRGCFHEDAGCSGPPANGTTGSVKLLENWKPSGTRYSHNMIGSTIWMWLPQYANIYSDIPSTHKVYVRPNRNWSFDSRFLDPNNLPPGTPSVGMVWRAAFRESY